MDANSPQLVDLVNLVLPIVSAFGAILAVYFSHDSARTAKRLEVDAVEKGKRTETVRLRGLDAVDKLLLAIADIYLSVSTVFYYNKHLSGSPDYDTKVHDLLKKVAESRSLCTQVRYTAAPYLDQDIIVEIDKLLARTATMDLSPSSEAETMQLFKDVTNMIASSARSNYLS